MSNAEQTTTLVAWALGFAALLGVVNLAWALFRLPSFAGRHVEMLRTSLKGFNTPDECSRILNSETERAEDVLTSTIGIARWISNMAVYGGLLGTLMGLSAGVQSIPKSSTQDPNLFAAAVSNTLTGFGGAFRSAIAGVGVTLLLGSLIAAYNLIALTVLHKFKSEAGEEVWNIVHGRPRADGQTLSPTETLRREIVSLINEVSLQFAEDHRLAGETMQSFSSKRRDG